MNLLNAMAIVTARMAYSRPVNDRTYHTNYDLLATNTLTNIHSRVARHLFRKKAKLFNHV